MTDSSPTVVILTALRLEYDAVRRHLTDVERRRSSSGTLFDYGRLDGTRWRIALAQTGQGNEHAAVVTEQAYSEFRPEALLFVGVAGSLRDDVVIGDVVVAQYVHNYQGAKVDREGSHTRPQGWKAGWPLTQTAGVTDYDALGLRVHSGSIAAGDVVLNNRASKLATQLRRHFNDALAIDMESAGAAQAAAIRKLDFLAVRGISDLADGHKQEADRSGSQQDAARNAAAVAVAILRELDRNPPPAPAPAAPPEPTPGGMAVPVPVPGAKPDGTLVMAPEAGRPNTETSPEPAARTSGTAPAPSDPEAASAQAFGHRRTPTASEAARPNSGLAVVRPLKASLSKPVRQWARHIADHRVASLSAAVAVAVALAFLLWPDKGPEQPPVRDPKLLGATLPSCSPDEADTTLRVAASVDLSKSLREAAAAYGPRRSEGRCVRIEVKGVNSGAAMRALARGWSEDDGDRPDVWSPAGSEWLSLARSKATPEALEQLPETGSPIVTSPLTIAMPETMARHLGWPEQRIGWTDLAEWAQNPQDFWSDRGQKQWGALKLGKTNPEYSTSGLNATIGAFYARTGTSAELSDKDVDAPANREFVRNIEESVVHYGDTTLTFLANLRAADDSGGAEEAQEYISAVTVEENAVVAYNQGYPCGAYSDQRGCGKRSKPKTQLVSLYPEDSNPVSDHPYIRLRSTGPGQAAKDAVSEDFLTYLHHPKVYREHFEPYGYRTHDGRTGKRITEENGALPDTALASYNAPRGEVLERLQRAWAELRRRANVLVVIDTSASMDDKVPGTGKTKMQLLREAEPALFGGFGDRDRVGLWRFSSEVSLGRKVPYQPLIPLGPMGETPPGYDGITRREQLAKEVYALEPDGATGLYSTVDAAVRTMRDAYDPNAINAIVLLTDGRNETRSRKPTLDDLVSRIGVPDKRIRTFTIAYGSDADEDDANGKTVLERIAAATGARAYDAKNPEVIDEVLTSVISNF